MSQRREIEEAASLWLVRRDEPGWSDAHEQELAEWLDASVAHKAAFWRMEDVFGRIDHLAATSRHARAQSRYASASTRSALSRLAATLPSFRSVWKPALLAGSAAAVLALGHLAIPRQAEPPRIAERATKFGQIGNLTLEDGSRIELNTDSAVRFAVSGTERMVWIDRGEVYFEVAHDRSRPFVLHAGSSRLTVLGTKFAVRRSANGDILSVVDGRVQLAPAKTSGEPTIITKGQIAATDGWSTLVKAGELEHIQKSLAWRRGVIVFDNSTLTEVAEQFNQYNRRKLVISGSEAAKLRVGGSFRLGNVEGFARLMEDAYGVRVSRNADEIKISSK